jgi:hypothetical protein
MTETALKPGLAAFFLRLGEDRSLLTDFERDPRHAMLQAGLGDDQVAALLDRGSEDVRLALEAELVLDPVWERVLAPTRMTHPTFTEDDDDDDQGDEDDGGDKGDDQPKPHGN